MKQDSQIHQCDSQLRQMMEVLFKLIRTCSIINLQINFKNDLFYVNIKILKTSLKGRWSLLRIQNLKTIIPIPMSLLHLSSFPPWRNSQFDSEENTSQFDPLVWTDQWSSMLTYIYIASLNVYILQLIKLEKKD